jgi:hypothetical protein
MDNINLRLVDSSPGTVLRSSVNTTTEYEFIAARTPSGDLIQTPPPGHQVDPGHERPGGGMMMLDVGERFRPARPLQETELARASVAST